MAGKIYLLQGDGAFQSLSEQPYVSEDLLQTLLADYPDLLAGEQINESAPRRWLLVSREVAVPGEQDGAGRWSLDHLFVDQDAIPTLVEVKRGDDTRIRREVVGQMLDYAANAVSYWTTDRLRSRFEAGCSEQDQDPVQLVAELLEAEPDETTADAFWEKVQTNLDAGKIRLIFVADEIPSELKRVVEFLNTYMNPVEVLAVEVRQYVGEGLKTLVPRVLGQTARSQGRKAARRPEPRQWDRESFTKDLQERQGDDLVAVAVKILTWAEEAGLRIWWGKGQQDGSFFPMTDHGGDVHWLISVWTYGRLEIQFQMMKKNPPFEDEKLRRDLLSRLNAITGIAFPENAITRRPSIPLSLLEDKATLEQFLEVLDWVIQEIRST